MEPSARPATARLCFPRLLLGAVALAPLVVPGPPAAAQGPGAAGPVRAAGGGDPIAIRRAAGSIVVDGDLSDPGWLGATRVETWYETNPGDNVEPRVASVAYLAYDADSFYAAFEFSDPEPQRIRAAFADHDDVPSYTDYGGVILDPRRDGTGYMFLANPRGIQYDAINSDAAGEDPAPDFFWDSAARLTDEGWRLEIRIPFSSLRYDGSSPDAWGVLLYRNWPRDRRYQMFSARVPRGANCFICNANELRGLEDLPAASHLVVAPYVSGDSRREPEGDLGSPLAAGGTGSDAGVDLKWAPGPDAVVDVTVNPDFSQVESDVAQIAANERFALFFPEKRPFFLEGVDLFDTPISAVYTRTITAPRWGARATGKHGASAYTLLVADDRGGGSAVVPGTQGSELVDQDLSSQVAVARLRHDLGGSQASFVSLLATAREIEGGAYNRVIGPDFRWTAGSHDQLAGQLLWAESETPDLPGSTETWDGRRLAGHAARLWWSHSTPTVDWFVQGEEVHRDFRADNGFVPQAGHREWYGEVGYTVRPEERWVSRWRTFLITDYAVERDGGELLFRGVSPGFGFDGRWNSFWRARLAFDRVRSGEREIDRNQLFLTAQVRPSKTLNNLYAEAVLGDEVDFANHRPADGTSLLLQANLRATDHLDLALDLRRRWLDVDAGAAGRGRLFTAQASRLQANYTFNRRMYLRLIGQYLDTERDPALYLDEVAAESGGFAGSALFAYKLNWQTVFYLGYGDDREITADGDLERAGDRVFAKVSYAFQR